MIHRVNIEKIITGGFGLGRLANGMVVLARYVLPGETVRLKEIAHHKGYVEASLVEIIDASPDRISPPCPYFTRCGGCDFQHMNASCQHRVKTGIIQESLERAKVSINKTDFQTIIPSPLSYHYRYRLRLKVGSSGQIGFYRTGSNDLVEITRCLLATDRINQALQELNNSDLFKHLTATISEVELLHNPADDLIFAILHPQRNRKIAKSQFSPFVTSLKTITNVLVKKGKKLQPLNDQTSSTFLSQEFDSSVCGRPFTLNWSPGCFSQVNAQQNTRLIDLVCRQYTKTGGQNILDMYCGMGNFSIPVGLSGAEIIGVEQNPESIRWAGLNAKKSGIAQYRFQTSDVGRYLQALQKTNDRFDVVLLDPPRQGLGKHTPLLARLGARNIIYISCDPATLARDLFLLTTSGYRLSSLTPVDMFPQTHHIESVAFLEKN